MSESNIICTLFANRKIVIFLYFLLFSPECVPIPGGQIRASASRVTGIVDRVHCCAYINGLTRQCTCYIFFAPRQQPRDAAIVIIDQFHKSQNAPVPYTTMLHSEQKYAHFCPEWSIVGYGTGAFWDFCDLGQLLRNKVRVSFLPLGLSWRRGIIVVCVCPSVRELYFVRTITRQRFEQE